MKIHTATLLMTDSGDEQIMFQEGGATREEALRKLDAAVKTTKKELGGFEDEPWLYDRTEVHETAEDGSRISFGDLLLLTSIIDV